MRHLDLWVVCVSASKACTIAQLLFGVCLSLYEGDQRVTSRHKYKIVCTSPRCHQQLKERDILPSRVDSSAVPQDGP